MLYFDCILFMSVLLMWQEIYGPSIVFFMFDTFSTISLLGLNIK